MTTKFKKIGLIGKHGDANILATLKIVLNLIQAAGCTYLLDKQTAKQLGEQEFTSVDSQRLVKECDLVITIGGDGTLLDAGRTLSEFEVPMLGINMGRLGFLVDLSPADIEETLPEILAGKYSEETRTLLEANITKNGKTIFKAKALNDIVIHKVNVARMIEFEVYINNTFVYTQRSDGLIISTPTGSTAYALSGGGPILHPTLEAIVLVPICPHTLSNRPIAIGVENEIEIKKVAGRLEGIRISCDGQINHTIGENESVKITVSKRKLRLLHPQNYDYYQILRAKLNWAAHNKNH